MDIRQGVQLRDLNTLSLPAVAEHFCTVTSDEELQEALAYSRRHSLAVTAIGGGSNLVLAGDIPGLVIRIASRGIEVVAEDTDSVQVRIAAGENWHQLVLATLSRGWSGLENLALIPGCAGAAPIQNIGAYGVELCEHFVSLEALMLPAGEKQSLAREECRFGYRDSIFKHRLRDRALITAITLALSKRPAPRLDYPELAAALADTPDPTPRQVCEAVVALRRRKLPDPDFRPNAGSFFKNPVVTNSRLQVLRKTYPEMPSYPLAEGGAKIPAAWLIDRAGWKGVTRGPVAVHDRQPLVLVNQGGAGGGELLALAAEIAADINRRYHITLEIEPRVLGDAAAGH